jgi:AbrB family looped-hinge helix DNA binding protein
MTVTIDRAGRVVIPAAVRERLGLRAGTRLELSLDEAGIRLVPSTSAPQIVTVNGRLVARPTVPAEERPAVDPAALIEEERNRWP